jgi:hypothetical protein
MYLANGSFRHDINVENFYLLKIRINLFEKGADWITPVGLFAWAKIK